MDSVSVKWLAVKTASEMTYIVSGGALKLYSFTHSWTQSPLEHLLNQNFPKITRAVPYHNANIPCKFH